MFYRNGCIMPLMLYFLFCLCRFYGKTVMSVFSLCTHHLYVLLMRMIKRLLCEAVVHAIQLSNSHLISYSHLVWLFRYGFYYDVVKWLDY